MTSHRTRKSKPPSAHSPPIHPKLAEEIPKKTPIESDTSGQGGKPKPLSNRRSNHQTQGLPNRRRGSSIAPNLTFRVSAARTGWRTQRGLDRRRGGSPRDASGNGGRSGGRAGYGSEMETGTSPMAWPEIAACSVLLRAWSWSLFASSTAGPGLRARRRNRRGGGGGACSRRRGAAEVASVGEVYRPKRGSPGWCVGASGQCTDGSTRSSAAEKGDFFSRYISRSIDPKKDNSLVCFFTFFFSLSVLF